MNQLKSDTKYGPVYHLLEVFLTGRLSDYLEFEAADAATLKNYGLPFSLASFPYNHKLFVYFGLNSFVTLTTYKNTCSEKSHLDAGLVHDECVTKMRLMSLVGLATTSDGEIAYSMIRDTLKVCCSCQLKHLYVLFMLRQPL